MTSLLRDVQWRDPTTPRLALSTKTLRLTCPAPSRGTLLVACPERRGVAGALEQLMYGHGADVLDSAQHTDHVGGIFFQRIRFELSSTTNRAALEAGVRQLCERFAMEHRLYGDRIRRIAILVSKQDHCLYDLLVRHRAGELPCEVTMIISNHPDSAASAHHFGIPFHHLPITPETKPAQEAAILDLLQAAGVELVVLARYMQILSPGFVERLPTRIINIHHSFLPAFIGANPYRQAYAKGVKLIGATSHYVTADLDEGAILEQEVVRCSHRDSVEDLERKGRDLEKRVLAAAVRWHLEDRIMVHAGKSVVFD